jgi:uncharacterized protein
MQELIQSLLVGASLVFIIEGILPFLAPNMWRKMIMTVVVNSNLRIRIFAAMSMLIGLVLLFIVRN